MTTNVVINWKKQLGENIIKARREFPGGMSQGQLADATGLSRNSIGHYERGERAPDIEDLRKIAAVLRADYFKIDDTLRIEFTLNGKPHLQSMPQQLRLDFDERGGVTVRIQSVSEGLIVEKIKA